MALLARKQHAGESSERVQERETTQPEAVAQPPAPAGLWARLYERVRLGVNTWWFPWALAAIGFMDYFTFCGVVLSPLLTLGFMAAPGHRRVVWLCTATSCGALAGSFAFANALDSLGLSGKLAGSEQLATARDLLQRHGLLAGLFNTLLPLPTIPLIVAARLVDANVPLMLLTMAAGRAVRYAAMFIAVSSGRSLYQHGTRGAGEKIETGPKPTKKAPE